MHTKSLALILFIVVSCFWIAKNTQTVQEANQNNNHSQLSVVDQEIQQQPHSVIFQHGGQWKDIQKSQNDFHWDQIDQAYSNAQKNKLDFEWIIQIDSEEYPQWTKRMSIEQKEQSLLNFFSIICGRYENVKNFILKDSNQAEGIRWAGEISKHCVKKHFLVRQKVERYNQLAQKQNVKGEKNKIKNGIAIAHYFQGNENSYQKIASRRLLESTAPVVNVNLNVFGYAVTGAANVQVTTGRTVIQYLWIIESGDVSLTTESIKYTYATPGMKLILLAVMDSESEMSVPYYLEFSVPSELPVAVFTSEVKKRKVNFDASSSTSKFSRVASYAWDFGDKSTVQTKTQSIISYTYAQGGSYPVTLTITDDKGAVGKISKTVLPVDNVIPTATIKLASIVGFTVNVEAIGVDTDGLILSYEWNWGVDGEDLGDSQSGSYFYQNNGKYTITLVVIDDNGGRSLPVTQEVNIPTNLPIASFEATVNRKVVTFNADASMSVLGSIVSYAWDFGDTKTQTTPDNSITHTYSQAKTYTVQLKVTDDKDLEGTKTNEVTTVLNAPPVAGFSYKATSLVVAFQSTSTDDTGIAQYTWNFGYVGGTGTGSKITHTFPSEKTYTVVLTVKDDDNVVRTFSNDVSVSVVSLVPLAASFTTQVRDNLILKVDASASTGSGSISKYIWSWGDGSSQNVDSGIGNHRYSKEGIYLVTLIVEDSKGVKSKIMEKAVMLLGERPEKLIKAWKEEITINTKTTSDAKNFITISKFVSNDGTIRTRRFFGKSTLRAA